jgi:4-hydroxy-3-methylbut-2-enyl diphosphate reductase
VKVNLAKSAGFCFGVRRALDIARKTAASRDAVYMLGDIVHNEEVAEEIRKSGINKIKRLTKGRGRTLLIRAHGSGQGIMQKAHHLGYRIVDATCPMVKEIHRIARLRESAGRCIIVIGDKKHDEVQGIVGQLKGKALVIDRPQNIPWAALAKIRSATVVVQSTQNLENVLFILKKLKAAVKDLEFFNTICKPTSIKQEEIRSLSRQNDAVVVIGSKASANTRRLYEISKSLNPKTYWVSEKLQIRPCWFQGLNSVGVTAGASTPDATTQAVIRRILSIPAGGR